MIPFALAQNNKSRSGSESMYKYTDIYLYVFISCSEFQKKGRGHDGWFTYLFSCFDLLSDISDFQCISAIQLHCSLNRTFLKMIGPADLFYFKDQCVFTLKCRCVDNWGSQTASLIHCSRKTAVQGGIFTFFYFSLLIYETLSKNPQWV